MKVFLLLILAIFIQSNISAQTDSLSVVREYPFILKDSPAKLFSMRQFNQNYLSAYRILSKELNRNIENKKISGYIQIAIVSLLFIPLTHEEGHRSILTGKSIGAISQPYINKHFAAYVTGVTDSALISLRNNDLPNYIRLHTAGLESDHMLTKRVEDLCFFEMDEFKNVRYEYLLRKIGILTYYLSGLFKSNFEIAEETNELERDIVGHDIYGAARHLHRPKMDFYRYTRYDDLTAEETDFVRRAGFRSLLNLLNPLMIGIDGFKLNEDIKFNIGMGYSLSPFGDYIEENIRLQFSKIYNLNVYVRQFENKSNWFHSFGLGITNLKLLDNLYSDLNCHYLSQPKDFSFTTTNTFNSGAVEVDLRYFFNFKPTAFIRGMSVNAGLIYKGIGYIPEEIYLQEAFGFRLGTSLLMD